MNKRNYFLPVFFLILSSSFFFDGCACIKSAFAPGPEISIRDGFTGENIAVLSFSRLPGTSSELARAAADNLTDALFLVNNYSVIDRSKINEAQYFLGIRNTDVLSLDQIQQAGLKLKAGYLILGRVDCPSAAALIPGNEPVSIQISFRIVSAKDGEIIGVVNYISSFKDHNAGEKAKEMIYKIAKEIKKSVRNTQAE